MQCPKCGQENPDDAYFCGSCGAQLRSSFSTNPEPVAPAPVATAPAPAADPSDPAPVNPFGSSEPSASAAYQHLIGESAAATPSVAPPPPPPQYAPPQPPPLYGPPPQAPPAQYGSPGGGYQAPYPPAPGYPPQGYGMPPDGNTSGMGQGYPVPPNASGWTFAGFIPWGLFSFCNGDTTWGVIGIALNIFGLGLGYVIYVGITGKESAWRNRRFNSIQQYEDTMKAWNAWGIGLLIAGGVFLLLYFVLIFGLAFSGALSK